MVGVSGIFLHMIVGIIVYDVFMRYFLKQATFWAGEIATYMMVYITLFTMAWLVRENRHVQVELLLNRVSYRSQKALGCIISLIASGLCFVLTFFGVLTAFYFINYKTPTLLALPKGWLMIGIPVGFFAAAVQFVINAFRHLRIRRGF